MEENPDHGWTTYFLGEIGDMAGAFGTVPFFGRLLSLAFRLRDIGARVTRLRQHIREMERLVLERDIANVDYVFSDEEEDWEEWHGIES